MLHLIIVNFDILDRFLYSKKPRNGGNVNNTTKGADSQIRRIDYSVQGYMSQLSSSTSPKFGKQGYITGNVAELDSKPWEECSFLTLNGIKSTIAESCQVSALLLSLISTYTA